MIEVKPNLYGALSELSKEKPWVIQIDNVQVALSYSELMRLGLLIWDFKEQTKVTQWSK